MGRKFGSKRRFSTVRPFFWGGGGAGINGRMDEGSKAKGLEIMIII